jgi:menaquinol-cytochrome c reductase iron-sulfur subunit
MSSDPDAKEAQDREVPRTSRRVLVLVTAAGACALGGAVVAPALTFALAPLRTHGDPKDRWVRTLRLDQLEDAKPRRVSILADRRDAWTVERGVELGSVWLVRRGAEVFALSAVCPHLGCSVTAVESDTGFACPCHTSAFAPDGKRTSGPSPRDLDKLATRIEDGHVWVDFRRFRIGIEAQEEIG